MRRLVLATGNPDKARELAPLLEETGVVPLVVSERVDGWEVEETGESLEENARLKARAAAQATGLPALGEDTGLFVDALDGAPGVHSSRYAGEDATYGDNVEKLLAALAEVPRERRAARFRTVAVLARPDEVERRFVGELAGRIALTPRGENGFGYDPVFEIAADGRTLAELPPGEKNRISHRARALQDLAAFLAANPSWLEEARV